MDPTSKEMMMIMMINERPRDEELREHDLLSWLGKRRCDDYIDMDCSLKLGPTVENITHRPSPSLPLVGDNYGLKTGGSAVVVAGNNSSNDNNMNGLNNIDDHLLGGGRGGGSGSPSLIPSEVAKQPESCGDGSASIGKSCAICKSIKTPRWRNHNGPNGREIICNACSNRIKREEKKAMEMERNRC